MKKVLLTRKKILLVLIVIFIIISIIVIYFISTRTVYWNNKYYVYDQPSKTDAEYLNVWDVRLILNTKDKEEIEDLGCKIVNDSLKYNGIITNELQGIITQSTFSYINPRDFLSKNDYEITNEKFNIKETAVLRHRNKAIFLYGCTYHATYLKNGKNDVYDTGYDGVPNRIYLEFINDKWIVTSAFRVG